MLITDDATTPSQTLAGRVALVTGGSRGVGSAIALTLARRGARVAVNYNRDAEAARGVVEQIAAASGEAHAFQATIGDDDSVEHMLEQIAARFGSLDLVVSNAGHASGGKKIIATPAEEYRELMEVHAFGPLRLIRSVLPTLREQERSDVIVISSSVTQIAPSHSAPYTMAKAAAEAAARTLAVEERKYGLRVNIVAPGLVATDMGRSLVSAAQDSTIGDLDAGFPYGRVCRPDDVAGVVAFLASPDAGYVNGQRILVDGGGSANAIY